MAKKRKKRWLKIGLPVAAGILIIVLIAANLLKKREAAVDVNAVEVHRGRLVQTVPGTGRVYPEVQVDISANVAGEITGIYVEEGDRVKRGDLLVTLDRQRYEAAVEQAQSSLKSAEAALDKARSELRRVEELYQRGMSSNADLEAAQAEFQFRSAEVERSRAFLKESNDDLAKTSIYSPMDGIVSALYKEAGEMAQGAQFQLDLIMTVSDLSKMEVVVEVDENDVVNVSLQDSARVKIDAFPDTTFRGTVREIAHTATTRGLGTAEEITNFVVKVALKEVPKGLRPGMSATADIVTEVREDALYVPIQCVVLKPPLKEEEPKEKMVDSGEARADTAASEEGEEHGEPSSEEPIEVVFRVDEDIAHQVSVATGISSDTDIEILSGLEEGNKVVSGPFRTLTQKLKDGDAVKAKMESKSNLRSRAERSGEQGEDAFIDEM